MTLVADWKRNVIKEDQISKYLNSDKSDFIQEERLNSALSKNVNSDPSRIREILAKSEAVETLSLDDTAALLNVTDDGLWREMEESAGRIKRKVYDNRIVTFAPLYLSTRCVNKCEYCGFRADNNAIQRGVLPLDKVKTETEVLAGKIGHKRLIVSYGEHPDSDVPYIADSIKTIYDVKVPVRSKGMGTIRRVNVNAAPFSIEDLRVLKDVGIGTYQVFQETYHHETYHKWHPSDTLKGNYRWRLYCMHRALEAGVDDVGIGALLGLFDWKFEVLGLLSHTHELEKKFGIGPHTISFPRLKPAENTPLAQKSDYMVNDKDFRKVVTVIRLAVPYTGMILTARECAAVRDEILPLSIVTQIDSSSKVGLGAYNDSKAEQVGSRQQFILGDTRSLDEVVGELAKMGCITSFCTAGYRCGRTGQCIMDLLRSGSEGKFCKLNAVITFREWLDDFASDNTKALGEKVIVKEIDEIRRKMPQVFDTFMEQYTKTSNGERDLYF